MKPEIPTVREIMYCIIVTVLFNLPMRFFDLNITFPEALFFGFIIGILTSGVVRIMIETKNIK